MTQTCTSHILSYTTVPPPGLRLVPGSMRSPDVCEGEVTHGGHSPGQHQLSECEVQPQAKASLACGDKPDPPVPPTPPHTGPEPGTAPAQSYLPPSKSLH